MNRRKFNRIAIDSRFDTDLFVYGRHYTNIIIRDLSLSGLFALGEYDGQECDECELLLKPLDNTQTTFLKIPCKIVRINETGIALEFMYPDTESLIFLETIVLYYADDPFTAATEFPDLSFDPVSQKCV